MDISKNFPYISIEEYEKMKQALVKIMNSNDYMKLFAIEDNEKCFLINVGCFPCSSDKDMCMGYAVIQKDLEHRESIPIEKAYDLFKHHIL